jgi:hypothetical protein
MAKILLATIYQSCTENPYAVLTISFKIATLMNCLECPLDVFTERILLAFQ